jgi:hypothetical protein
MATLTQEQLQANTKLNNASNPLYNNTITPSQLAPATPVNIGTPTTDTTNYAGITGGVSDSILNEYTNLNNKLTTEQQNQDKAGTSIIDAMNALTGKTADQQAANESQGVNTETANLNKYAEQLAGLNAQASVLNREAQAVPLQVQENNRNTGATDRGVAPQEAGALRLNALKALSIAQQSDIAAAAATGSQLRLQAAKDKAQQIVDLKYKPLEDALAIKKQQYELNKDLLSSIDKKRTEALNIALKKEEQTLADAKELEKYKTEITTTAMAAGAPANLIDAASKAKTTLEAAQILGKYSPETLKYELLKEQIKTEKAQRANINSQINERDNKALTAGNLKQEDVAKAIESKSGQRAVARKDLITQLNALDALYTKYGARPTTAEGIGAIDSARSAAQLAIATANGQGAISDGDRTSYNALVGKSLGAAPTAKLKQTIATQKAAYGNDIAVLNTAYPGIDKLDYFSSVSTSPNKFAEVAGTQPNQTVNTTNISVKPDGSLDWQLPGSKK